MKLTTPNQPDDASRVARARDHTALRHIRHAPTTPLRTEDGVGEPSTTIATATRLESVQPAAKDSPQVEENDYEAASVGFDTSWRTPPADDTVPVQPYLVQGTPKS